MTILVFWFGLIIPWLCKNIHFGFLLENKISRKKMWIMYILTILNTVIEVTYNKNTDIE